MDVTKRLQRWLARHPLKEPPPAERAQYTAEVMAKLKALHHPARILSPSWFSWPRLAFVAATAASTILIVGTLTRVPGARLAQDIEQEAELLAALKQPVLRLPVENVGELSHELEQMDAMVLAESPPSDDAWIEQTVQLLEQLNEEAPDEAVDTPSDDGWLKELEMLDESELTTTSL